jgi:hypothetical protein
VIPVALDAVSVIRALVATGRGSGTAGTTGLKRSANPSTPGSYHWGIPPSCDNGENQPWEGNAANATRFQILRLRIVMPVDAGSRRVHPSHPPSTRGRIASSRPSAGAS